MKKLVLVALVVVAGLVVYNTVTTGKPSLFPSSSASPEERRLEALEARLDAAGRDITQAGRAAGFAGMDSTAQAESAMRELERVENDLLALEKSAASAAVKEKCERLAMKARSLRGAR